MDVVVTVPSNFTYSCAPDRAGYAAWIAEGDAPGTEWSGQEWAFPCGGRRPIIDAGERVYVVCQERLRGYAPIIRLDYKENPRTGRMCYYLVRGGGAVASGLAERVVGFRGWKYRWWDRQSELTSYGVTYR